MAVAVPNCDVAVIGGGILGLATAALTAQRGFGVHVYRLGNHGRPRADTLRNQGWLQSGLIYVGKIGQTRNGKPISGDNRDKDEVRKRGRILADQMYVAGLTMLDGLEIPRPKVKDRGILRVYQDDDNERTFLADAEYLGFKDVVQKLPADMVRQRLGPLFEEGSYYVIPDAPFPEAMALEALRTSASEAGAVFIECNAPVLLEKDDRSPSGHVITSDAGSHSSLATIVAAGAGSYELLTHLGVDPRMKLQQTPLLVVDGFHSIETPIFADRPRGFSFVRHPPGGEALPAGALVIGTGVVEKDIAYAPYDERRIRETHIEAFRDSLPACLKGHVETGRFTAGYEVVPDGVMDEEGYDLHYVEPWVEWVGVDNGMHLLLAMPGRATMGMFSAERVLDELEARIGPPSNGPTRSVVTGGWNGAIHMHFERYYSFDDRERSEER